MPKNFTSNIVFFVIAVLLLSSLILRVKLFNAEWLVGSAIIILICLLAIENNFKKWKRYSSVGFQKKLFLSSFLLRLFILLIISVIAEMYHQRPIFVGAMDAAKYHRVAIENIQLFWHSGWEGIIANLYDEYQGIDDFGFPLFLTFMYALTFKSIYITKILLAAISSLAVVYGYKLTRLLWDENTARVAGLILMAFPLSLFYGVILMKENLMVLLIMAGSYNITKMYVNQKFNLRLISIIIAQVTALFFFRSAIGALMILLMLAAFIFNYYKGSKWVSITIGLLLTSLFLIILHFFGLTALYVEKISAAASTFGDARIEHARTINTWVDLASLPLLVGASFLAPFPTLIDVYNLLEGSNFQTTHGPFNYYLPGLLMWNSLGLFFIYGLLFSVKKMYRRKSILIWGFVGGYSYILIDTLLFTSTRFSYVAMPAMLILAAVGMRHTKALKYWKLYLIMMVFIIVGWNYFKAGGRGLL